MERLKVKFIFLSLYLFLLGFLFWFVSCAPLKTQIEDYELERILERAAERKIHYLVGLPSEKTMPNDWEIFSETCKIYYIDPEVAYQKLEEKKPSLAKHLRSLK